LARRNPAALSYLGRPYGKAGRQGEAQQALNKLVEMSPFAKSWLGLVRQTGEQRFHALARLPRARAVGRLDAMMPEMDGISLIKRVKANPKLADIPIIVMSGARSGSIQEALNAGATEALRKPVDIVDVVRAVDKFIPNRSPLTRPQKP
jgi:CheY-like chemotaxis protein